jgi:hypothetical protein
MNCINCQEVINPLRIKAMPNAKTCVACSTTERVGCHVVISGKTEYSEIQIVDKQTASRLYGMQSRSGFGIAKGVKFQFDSRSN